MKQTKQQFKSFKKQAGITLMEVIGSLLVIGLVVSGALSLFGSADSSQKGNQMLADINAIRSAVKGMYSGQGGYGATSLNSVLISAKKIPSSMTTSGTTITHSMNGTLTVTGATALFNIAITNVPTDVCVQLVSNSTAGWTSIQVGSASAFTTFPVSPATAAGASYCAASNANTLTFISG